MLWGVIAIVVAFAFFVFVILRSARGLWSVRSTDGGHFGADGGSGHANAYAGGCDHGGGAGSGSDCGGGDGGGGGGDGGGGEISSRPGFFSPRKISNLQHPTVM